MAKESLALVNKNYYKNKFTEELLERTSLLTFKAENGNYLVVVDLSDCSKLFIKKAEFYFKENENLKTHIIGPEYYLEVLNGGIYPDAYYN